MTNDNEIRDLLIEIRDNQKLALERQEEQLAIAREQAERSRRQIEESLELQRAAVQKTANITRIALPGILFCVLLIVYLLIRYF